MDRYPTYELLEIEVPELSTLFEMRWEPSLLKRIPVTLSKWPRRTSDIFSARMSHTFISLSIPPEIIESPNELKQHVKFY